MRNEASHFRGCRLSWGTSSAFAGVRNVVQVGTYDGWFKSLLIVVQTDDSQLVNLVVTHGKGEKEGFDTMLDFAADYRSRAVPLEGEAAHQVVCLRMQDCRKLAGEVRVGV
jgi:hypothetical protein